VALSCTVMVIRFGVGALLALIFPILGTIALAALVLVALLNWGAQTRTTA
jgi:uncharacterized membrane protein YkvI